MTRVRPDDTPSDSAVGSSRRTSVGLTSLGLSLRREEVLDRVGDTDRLGSPDDSRQQVDEALPDGWHLRQVKEEAGAVREGGRIIDAYRHSFS